MSTSKDNPASIEIFQTIKNKVTKNNFILLSGDTILDINFAQMLDRHILEEALVSMVLLKDDNKFGNNKLKYISSDPEINVFGLESSSCDDEKYREVIFHKTIWDEKEDKVSIPIKLLNKTKNLELIYNYDDIHLYVFNRSIFKLLDDEKVKSLTMIKSDFIPFLIKNKDSKRLKSTLQQSGHDNHSKQEIRIKSFMVDNNQKNYA
jgi:ADP-glucose pyrophosphorylase